MNALPIRIVVLDRDETLIRMPPGRRYVYGSDDVVFVDGAPQLVARLNQAGIRVVVATNQQGVSLKEHPEITLQSVRRYHERIDETLRHWGGHIDRYYVCPHARTAECFCRKPRPGMIFRALRDFELGPHDAAAIGDQVRDVAAAHAAGIRRLLLLGSSADAAPAPRTVRTIASLHDAWGALSS
jgi:D-glycero-D-manno-heptose 1,7-bisphosphate phosphatase